MGAKTMAKKQPQVKFLGIKITKKVAVTVSAHRC